MDSMMRDGDLMAPETNRARFVNRRDLGSGYSCQKWAVVTLLLCCGYRG